MKTQTYNKSELLTEVRLLNTFQSFKVLNSDFKCFASINKTAESGVYPVNTVYYVYSIDDYNKLKRINNIGD